MARTKPHIWDLVLGEGPVVAVALHHGHALRPEVLACIGLDDEERLREEDPFTGRFATVCETRFVGLHSRFEVDLNRPREQAVYAGPEEAWGLDVWKRPLPPGERERSLEGHDAFFGAVWDVLHRMEQRHGRFVVLDLHSYNHMREGPDAPPADASQNPEVNVGTGTMDRSRWAPVVDRFISDLCDADFLGRRLDVRENVRFRGGYFPRWVHEKFPDTGCALAIEFKKFFMNEWTGELFESEMNALTGALDRTLPGLREALGQMA